MKKLITLFLLLLSLHSYAQDFSTINFIGRGAGFAYNIYINQLLIGTVKGKQVLQYKMYTEGGIQIDVVWNGKKDKENMYVKHGETYYFECYGLDDREVGKMKAKGLLKENESTVQAEEGKNNVVEKAAEPDISTARQGTCFLVNRKGYMITSYHILMNAKTVQVKGIGGDFSTLYGAEVVAYDADMDMALIRIKNPNILFDSIPYRLSLEASQQGAEAFVTGYSLTAVAGDTMKTVQGIISAKTGSRGSISEYHFSQPMQPGNSGSPLFNNKGEITGIINTNLKEVEGTSYAVKSPYIQAFLMSTENVTSDMSATTVANQAAPDKIARLKNFIFIVRAE